MSICKHSELLKICEIVQDEKIIKEYLCENCLSIFLPCPADKNEAKTPQHMETCSQCKNRKKRTKFRIVKDSWQEQLLELGNGVCANKTIRT